MTKRFTAARQASLHRWMDWPTLCWNCRWRGSMHAAAPSRLWESFWRTCAALTTCPAAAWPDSVPCGVLVGRGLPHHRRRLRGAPRQTAFEWQELAASGIGLRLAQDELHCSVGPALFLVPSKKDSSDQDVGQSDSSQAQPRAAL